MASEKRWLCGVVVTLTIESIAMDGFTGFKSAAQEALPQAQTVLDPFHVVRWASNMLDECRRRGNTTSWAAEGVKTTRSTKAVERY